MHLHLQRWLIFGLALLGWLGAAPARAQNATIAPKPATGPVPLRVAVDPHAPPLIYKTGDKYSGLEADFARGLAGALGRPVEFVEAPWGDLITTLIDNRADIVMSGMSITQLRQVRAAFCNPYLRIGQVPLCRKSDIAVYANSNGLYNLGVNIATIADTSGDSVAQAKFAYAKRTSYPAVADAVQALLDQKADLVILDYPLALWQCSENESTLSIVPTFLTQEDLAWAVGKDDDDLYVGANAYLDYIKKNGELTQMIRKWLPTVADAAIAPTAAPDAVLPPSFVVPGVTGNATPAAPAARPPAAIPARNH